MFTHKDFSLFSQKYFIIICTSAYHIIIKSKNTQHTWHLHAYSLDGKHYSIHVYHKHHDYDEFHWQSGMRSANCMEAVTHIKKHDAWFLTKKKHA